jgi:protein phosphatase
VIELRVSGLTDVGRARKHNEDCYEIDRDRLLFVVADGMGGHSHGEVASRIAVDTIRDFIQRDSKGELQPGQAGAVTEESWREHSRQLRRAVRQAHDQVLEAIHQDGSLQGMGTTVVGLLVRDRTAALAHVGDSRAYRIRGGELRQLTQDHTWVHEQVKAGYLSEEQARHHPLKNVVTRALGSDKEVLVDLQELEVDAGDLYLICSDGLTTMLDDTEILRIVQLGGSLDETCRRLIAEANARGGLDNVTVILIAIDEKKAGARVEKRVKKYEDTLVFETSGGTIKILPVKDTPPPASADPPAGDRPPADKAPAADKPAAAGDKPPGDGKPPADGKPPVDGKPKDG